MDKVVNITDFRGQVVVEEVGVVCVDISNFLSFYLIEIITQSGNKALSKVVKQ